MLEQQTNNEHSFVDLGFAKPDTGRKSRCGATEVIYGAGKTPQQIVDIAQALIDAGEPRVLVTRLDETKATMVGALLNVNNAIEGQDIAQASFSYDAVSRLAVICSTPSDNTHAYASPDTQASNATGIGTILVVCAGTSDLPVAEEAAQTSEFLGNRVARLYDVGVAGIHRLMAHEEEIKTASVIIVVAGMEGALASVVGGMASCPIIAVPTSVGYGAAFDGLAALLSMLNSCANGVSVVNIDNGFGAGFQAHLINHVGRFVL